MIPNSSNTIRHKTTPTYARMSYGRHSQKRENILLLWASSAGARQSQGFSQEQEMGTYNDRVRKHW